MAIYAIVKMELNVEKQTKAGKAYSVHNISLKNLETDKFKNETVFANSAIGNAVAVLNKGMEVECKWTKKDLNGKDVFDLTEIKPVAEGTPRTPSKVSEPPKKGGFGKSPEEQQSIARQNVSRTSMDFVTKLVDIGVYDKKKVNPDFIFDEVIRFARRFEMYVTLQDDKLQPIDVGDFIVPTSADTIDDDDLPF